MSVSVCFCLFLSVSVCFCLIILFGTIQLNFCVCINGNDDYDADDDDDDNNNDNNNDNDDDDDDDDDDVGDDDDDDNNNDNNNDNDNDDDDDDYDDDDDDGDDGLLLLFSRHGLWKGSITTMLLQKRLRLSASELCTHLGLFSISICRVLVMISLVVLVYSCWTLCWGDLSFPRIIRILMVFS